MLRFVVPFLGLSKLSLSQDLTNVEDIKVLSELPIDRLLTLRRGYSVENEESCMNFTEDGIESRTFPEALALQGKSKIKDRGGHSSGGGHSGGGHYYYEEHYEKDGGKKNKIQSIFQLSITSLAFLAFGGYLLCLLIHAIKGKQNYYNNTNPAIVQAFATYVAQKIKNVKNKRPRKRRKNLKLQKRPNRYSQAQKRPNRNVKKPNNNVQKKPSVNRNPYIYGEAPTPIKHRSRRDVNESIDDSAGFLVTDEYLYHALVDLSEAYTKYNTFDYIQYNRTKYGL